MALSISEFATHLRGILRGTCAAPTPTPTPGRYSYRTRSTVGISYEYRTPICCKFWPGPPIGVRVGSKFVKNPSIWHPRRRKVSIANNTAPQRHPSSPPPAPPPSPCLSPCPPHIIYGNAPPLIPLHVGFTPVVRVHPG
jgi:hypothetical protein